MKIQNTIYLAIKYHSDHRNKKLIEEITLACNNAGYLCFCFARDAEVWGEVKFTPEEMMKMAFDKIRKASYILIDLSEKGVGVGIEAGYAYANGTPIVVIYPKGTDISVTLAGIVDFKYEYTEIQEVTKFLINLQIK